MCPVKNESSLDRGLRMGIGAILLIAGMYFESWFGLIGLVPLITGMMGFCPIYSLFHFTTKKGKSTEAKKATESTPDAKE